MGMALNGLASIAFAQAPARLPGEASAALPWAVTLGIVVVVTAAAVVNARRRPKG